MSFAGLWSTNVPAHDAETVAETLPGSEASQRSIQDSQPPPGGPVRVLSLTIHDRLTPALLDALPDLEAVVTRSDGFDHLPLDDLRRRGVAAYHLEGYATASVARLALTMLQCLLRRLPEAGHRLRTGSWTREPFVGRDLDEVTVGVLGAGRIGGSLARMVTALGGRVLAHDPVRDPALDGVVRWTDGLDDLLRRSDALSLHVPLTPATRGLLDADRLALLPPGAVLVNTARGDVVDQGAVEAALRGGRLAGYAADVLPGEPHCPDLERFRDLPNVLLSPHLGAHNTATLRRRYEATATIARAVLEGRPEAVAAYRVDATAAATAPT